MPNFELQINIKNSRWFAEGGNDLYLPLVKNEHQNPILSAEELSAFIEKAVQIPHWTDDNLKINPNMEHTISWKLKE